MNTQEFDRKNERTIVVAEGFAPIVALCGYGATLKETFSARNRRRQNRHRFKRKISRNERGYNRARRRSFHFEPGREIRRFSGGNVSDSGEIGEIYSSFERLTSNESNDLLGALVASTQ